MLRFSAIAVALILVIGWFVFGGLELEDRVDAAGSETASTVDPDDVQSPIVRSLLQAIDEIKGESPEVKDELRRSLLAADAELAEALGDTPKRLIEKANRKPSPDVSLPRPEASADPGNSRAASAKKAGDRLVRVDRLSPDPENGASDEPQTSIIKALLAALDEAGGDDDSAAGELRTTLIEADKELRKVLGGRSKRLIEMANRKPVVRVVGPPRKSNPEKKASAANGRSRKAAAGPQPAAPSTPDGEPRTEIVRALIEAIDQIEDEDEDTKENVKQSLMQADSELSRILGGKSKRMIERANRKPVAPRIIGKIPSPKTSGARDEDEEKE